jgi:spermidine/putrescine transport system ATP-binding protein
MTKIQVALDGVVLDYGTHRVLQKTDLAINEGEFLTILGPSGSGKTTILRLLGGFLRPSSGRILLDGKDISDLPPERRPFNTVFQDYALFPHMSVGENVAYSLRLRGVARANRLAAADEALSLVGLSGFSGRRISQLSGGQQQRVALARAIVSKPSVVLLDEPLSALDASLRRQMQLFLKSIQRKLGTTFVFVTHDQEEALSMSDRIVVMNVGRIVQIGTPTSIYHAPCSAFVAAFIGRNNLLPGTFDRATRLFTTLAGPILFDETYSAEIGDFSEIAVRPECLAVSQRGGATSDLSVNRLPGTVEDTTFSGSHYSYQVRVAEGTVLECTGSAQTDLIFQVGDEVDVLFSAQNVRMVAQ